MAKNTNEVDFSSINILGSGTTIRGEVIANGDLRVDGEVNGTLNVKGKLVVGTTGSVEGDISCQNAEFSGNIKANVTVMELLSLKSTAKLIGDISVDKLSIEPGAAFSGTCKMNNVTPGYNHMSGKDE
jgi:cytoskeletal protein CcmA (bactofilin family)